MPRFTDSDNFQVVSDDGISNFPMLPNDQTFHVAILRPHPLQLIDLVLTRFDFVGASAGVEGRA